jgi:hypothetical protein
VPKLILKIKANAAAAIQIFWANEEGGFSETRSSIRGYSASDIDTWKEIEFNLSNDPDWMGKTIKSFRIDPVSGNNSTLFEIDWIRSIHYTDCSFNAAKSAQAITKLPASNQNIEQLLLYPNPTNNRGEFFLDIPADMDDLELTIYNALGAKLYYKKGFVAGKKAAIRTSFTQKEGLYFVKLNSKGKTTIKKILMMPRAD